MLPDQRAELLWKAKKGGRNQRAKAQAALAAEDAPMEQQTRVSKLFDSSLAARLVVQWGWGHMSAPEVQKIAKAAFDDQVAVLEKLRLDKQHVP